MKGGAVVVGFGIVHPVLITSHSVQLPVGNGHMGHPSDGHPSSVLTHEPLAHTNTQLVQLGLYVVVVVGPGVVVVVPGPGVVVVVVVGQLGCGLPAACAQTVFVFS